MKKSDQFIYPSSSVSNIIHTDFIDGVRFDVWEVEECAFDMLSSSGSRFYLTCEDVLDFGVSIAIEYFKKSNEVRWDFFCKTKKECLEGITRFETLTSEHVSAKKRASNKAFAVRYAPIEKALRLKIKAIYGYIT